MIKLTDDFYKGLLDNLHDGVYFVDKDRGIVYWNKGAERITGYSGDEVVGSHCWDGILMHVDAKGTNLCHTGCPIAQVISSGTPTEAEIFFYHKDGHRVPVQIRATPIVDGEGTIVGAVEIFSDMTEKVTALELVEELQRKVFLDSLTGLANRRYVAMSIQTRQDELLRYGWQFGVIMMDLDHFKEVNDQYGHDIGDEALKMVARTLLHNSRPSDIVGRWGGEEFIVVIANTNALKLHLNAERYRALVERSGLPVGTDTIRLTISAGATIATPADTMDSVIKRADKLLYANKSAGRNQVTVD